MSYLNGLLDLPWWGYALYTLIVVQITIAAITLYLHRCQAHLSLELHPLLAHFFRFWLWLTTGMSALEWVTVHRKHHATCETEDDPHSPRVYGIKTVFFQGSELYRKEAKNPETLTRYSHGLPTDWLEKHVYNGVVSVFGVSILFCINFALFGFFGIAIWAIQMLWIPVHAAGGINGIGHYWGYRNYETPDDSTNIVPWAFWVGGEELHNNHHAYPSSAKFSIKPWEFDIGWLYINVLHWCGFARVKKVAPQPIIDDAKQQVDMETVKAVIRSKMHVMSDYTNNVIKPVLCEERDKAERMGKQMLNKAKASLILDVSRLQAHHRERLDQVIQNFSQIKTVYQYRMQLLEIWEKTYSSQEKLLQALKDWCNQAEKSGINALQNFAASLRGYTLQPIQF